MLQYRAELTKYNQEVKKAKKNFWKKMTEEINNTEVVGRLHKLLSKNHQNSLGTFKKPDGTYTNGKLETF